MRLPQPARPDAASTAVRKTTVGRAMHRGIVTVTADTDLSGLAATMSQHRVHCVAVESGGIVTDVDLVRALDAGRPLPASTLAATEALTVAEATPLDEAVRRLLDHELTHLVVVDAHGSPVGVLSTLDVARVAGGAD